MGLPIATAPTNGLGEHKAPHGKSKRIDAVARKTSEDSHEIQRRGFTLTGPDECCPDRDRFEPASVWLDPCGVGGRSIRVRLLRHAAPSYWKIGPQPSGRLGYTD